MSLFDKIKAGLGKAAEEAAEAAEIARIRVEITNLKRKMDEEAKKIGYAIYEKYKKGEFSDPSVAQYLANMKTIEQQLSLIHI